jgi:hypothetical protein
MIEDGFQVGMAATILSFNVANTGVRSSSFELDVMNHATGIPFHHSSNTIIVYKRYCR